MTQTKTLASALVKLKRCQVLAMMHRISATLMIQLQRVTQQVAVCCRRMQASVCCYFCTQDCLISLAGTCESGEQLSPFNMGTLSVVKQLTGKLKAGT